MSPIFVQRSFYFKIFNPCEACQCGSIITEFHLAITRMSELGVLEKLADQVVMEIVQEKINNHVQVTCK